jgi:hypothetical protein
MVTAIVHLGTIILPHGIITFLDAKMVAQILEMVRGDANTPEQA